MTVPQTIISIRNKSLKLKIKVQAMPIRTLRTNENPSQCKSKSKNSISLMMTMNLISIITKATLTSTTAHLKRMQPFQTEAPQNRLRVKGKTNKKLLLETKMSNRH
jgi:hypothetical protein